jgi:hypothetical protein
VLTIVAIESRVINGTLGIAAHGFDPEMDIIWTAGDSSLP